MLVDNAVLVVEIYQERESTLTGPGSIIGTARSDRAVGRHPVPLHGVPADDLRREEHITIYLAQLAVTISVSLLASGWGGELIPMPGADEDPAAVRSPFIRCSSAMRGC